MKKSKHSTMVLHGKNQSMSSSKASSPEKSKSDLSYVSTTPTKKVSISEKAVQEKLAKPLSKTFLSKSHDNLASTLRRRANTQGNPQIQSTLGISKHSDDKRPMSATSRDKTSPGKQSKSKALSYVGSPSMRKASSTQSIDRAGNLKSGSPMKKASSIQNINKAQATVPRRVSSSQSINKDKRMNRTSAPSNVMAYNAELLANFEKDKRNLEARISELIQIAECRKGDIEKYRFEVRQLREKVDKSATLNEEVDVLQHENKLLKDRLLELGIPVQQITDSEKLSLLEQAKKTGDLSTTDNQNSDVDNQDAAVPKLTDGDNKSNDNILASTSEASLGEFKCNTPDHPSCLSLDNGQWWEKQSNKSSDALSEVSVACLQDRIVQMEETHYSTSEELQATLQELGDLQDTVNDLTNDNEQLADERSVLLESLCTQTEKLENCRTQIEHLKALLLTDMGNGDRTDRECQLVELLKCAQEEREELMLKLQELNNVVQTTDNDNREVQDVVTALKDKVALLEDKCDVLSAEKRALEYKVAEQISRIENDDIEIERLMKSVANKKARVEELQQARKAEDKSDLDELLDKTRLEKEKVETQLNELQEKLSFKERETTKLKEQLSKLERDLNTAQTDQNSEIEDLMTKIEKLESYKIELDQQSESLRDHIDQLERDNDRYLEEKKSYSSTIAELQNELKIVQDQNSQMIEEIEQKEHEYKSEIQDWKQFQMDLQTAVVIANDIKTETQEDMEQLKQDNINYREVNRQLRLEVGKLENELDRLHIQSTQAGGFSVNELQKRMMPNVDRELSILRQGRKPTDSRTFNKDDSQIHDVKKIIRSIEDQVKGGTPSKSSSTSSSRRSSLESIKEQSAKSPSPTDGRRSSAPGESPIKAGILRKPDSAKDKHRHMTSIIYEDQQAPVTDDLKSSPSRERSEMDGSKVTMSILSNKPSTRRNSMCEQEKKDPLAGLVKQTGGSKRNALLKWCQHKTAPYPGIDITNFSSSWNDGLAFCALLHSYLPDLIPYGELNNADDKRGNFSMAFKAADSVGIQSSLNVNDMACTERPDWMAVMSYVTSIYKHFEVDIH